MPKEKAVIVSFEGIDGVGKSTQIDRVFEELGRAGHLVAKAKLPAYDTFTGRIIRRMLKNGAAVKYPNLFQTVQWVDKHVFQWTKLKKLLRENDFVLLDRWHASMWAYGLAGGANEKLTNYYVDSIREPHAVLVFSGTCKRDSAEDSYETDAWFQSAVKLHYVLWTCIRPSNSYVINADASEQAVTQEVLNVIYSIS